jgi:hypothetical protein
MNQDKIIHTGFGGRGVLIAKKQSIHIGREIRHGSEPGNANHG